MDYIINPMWFYFLQIVNSISAVVIIIAIIFGIGAIFATICCICVCLDDDFDEDNKDAKALAKWTKRVVWIFIISLLIAIFLPTKDTLISMMIAKYATKTNAQLTVDAIKGAVDYIVQAIQNVK